MRPLLPLLTCLLFAPGLAAQVVTGVLTDRETGRPVPEASVFLVLPDSSVGAEATTARDGVFALAAPGAGRYGILVDGGGPYELSEFGPVAVGAAGVTVRLEIPRRPVVLDPVTVRAMSRLDRAAFGGFRQRMESGHPGRYFDREAMERTRAQTLSDLLRRVPALEVTVGWGPNAQEYQPLAVRLRQPLSVEGSCAVLFYLDGMRVEPEAVAHLPLAQLEGVEVHTGAAVPAELASVSGAACGVVAVWTRRS